MKQNMIVILDLWKHREYSTRQIGDLGVYSESIPMILRWRSFGLWIM